jgi:DNA polymerase-4
MGITTVGDIARCTESRLTAALGESAGRRLLDLANNRDPRQVAPRAPRRSIGAQSAFPRSSRSFEEVEALAAGLVDRTTRRLRASGQVCGGVSIAIRFDDMKRASRSHRLPAATASTESVLAAVRALLKGGRPLIEERGITLLGVTLEDLAADDALQLELPLAGGGGESSALDAAVDELRRRFGSKAVTRASLVDNLGVEAPLLPD